MILVAVVLVGAFLCQGWWLAMSMHGVEWTFGVVLSVISTGILVVATRLRPGWWKALAGISISPITGLVLLQAAGNSGTLSGDEWLLLIGMLALFAAPAIVGALIASRLSPQRAP